MNDEVKELITNSKLKEDVNRFLENYSKIYTHYYSDKRVSDDVYMNELAGVLLGIFSLFEAYSNGFNIYPGYALEKLKYSKNCLQDTIDYFELKLEEEGN